jgi:hypothetical protein
LGKNGVVMPISFWYALAAKVRTVPIWHFQPNRPTTGDVGHDIDPAGRLRREVLLELGDIFEESSSKLAFPIRKRANWSWVSPRRGSPNWGCTCDMPAIVSRAMAATAGPMMPAYPTRLNAMTLVLRFGV